MGYKCEACGAGEENAGSCNCGEEMKCENCHGASCSCGSGGDAAPSESSNEASE